MKKRILIVAVIAIVSVIIASVYFQEEQRKVYLQEEQRKQREKEIISAFHQETNKLVESKGYSKDEILQLQDFQKVDKIYDNVVLERVNKVMGYIYRNEVTTKRTLLEEDDSSYENYLDCSINTPDIYIARMEMQNDNIYFLTSKLEGYIILPCYWGSPGYGDNREEKYTKYNLGIDIYGKGQMPDINYSKEYQELLGGEAKKEIFVESSIYGSCINENSNSLVGILPDDLNKYNTFTSENIAFFESEGVLLKYKTFKFAFTDNSDQSIYESEIGGWQFVTQ